MGLPRRDIKQTQQSSKTHIGQTGQGAQDHDHDGNTFPAA